MPCSVTTIGKAKTRPVLGTDLSFIDIVAGGGNARSKAFLVLAK